MFLEGQFIASAQFYKHGLSGDKITALSRSFSNVQKNTATNTVTMKT